ncbi:MAG: hypothetical protein A2W99_07215 [Bacteroidetes bacterium GWF2_33_16]|nr:MAG: hypothetical protein A2X00_11995 [Bacteroidetes bacterium GWE2_32_14]OFY03182.1 MAG: hypothetical protein A2W99_07215 [Bacteroidetes bacterium GWF2_33_16]
MKKINLLTMGLLLSSLVSIAQINWKIYDYSSLNFKIGFYNEPNLSIDSSFLNDSPLISYLLETNIEDSLHENNYYSVSLVTYPTDFIHSDSSLSTVEGFINSTQNSILDDEIYTLLSSTLIEKDGFPGKSFKWKNNSSNIFFEFQVYLVENKLFQLSVVSREGKNHNTFINKYFDSFELINITKGDFSIPKYISKRTLSITFPGVPTANNNIVDSEYGKLSLDIQIYEPNTEDKNMVYVAMETKYPYAIFDKNDTSALNEFYRKSIDGSTNSVNGQLASINDIYYDGNLGKEFRCYFSGGNALMVYRLFYIGGIFYNFGVITLPETDKNKAMNDFFDSFGIIE